MTRRHFEAIAKSIKLNIALREQAQEIVAVGALEQQARDLADIFEDVNPNFDRDRFLAACGVDD